MENISIELVENEDIELCRDLCNELMAFQKSKAFIAPESFDMMNFDTRMKKSYQSALEKQVLVAKDKGNPVAYVFSTIEKITKEENVGLPGWAPPAKNSIGFYPDWVKLPQKIGCLSNLYLKKEYRGTGLSVELCDKAMDWLKSFSDVNLIFVFISNGNDRALDFYLKRGFTFSHDVFGGFIKAAYISKEPITNL